VCEQVQLFPGNLLYVKNARRHELAVAPSLGRVDRTQSDQERRMQEVLTRPLTHVQMRRQMDANGYVEGIVPVDLDEIIDSDRDTFIGMLSEMLTDSADLDELEYEVVGYDGDTLHILVSGDATSLLDETEEEEEEEDEEDDFR
jgi:hypothetical protein